MLFRLQNNNTTTIDCLIVRFGWDESRLRKTRIKVFGILTPIVISIAIAILPLPNERYNYSTYRFFCGIIDYPNGCYASDSVECIRGGTTPLVPSIFGLSYLIIGILTIATIICTMLLIFEMYIQVKKSTQDLPQEQEEIRVYLIKTAWQGIRYFGVYYFCYFPPCIRLVYINGGLTPPTAADYFYLIVFPLSGCFTAFVYFRPRYLDYKEANPGMSWKDCIRSLYTKSMRENAVDDSIQTTSTTVTSHGDGTNGEEDTNSENDIM